MVEIHKYLLGQAMKKRPTGHYKKYTLQGERHCTYSTTSRREGSCIVDSSTSGERTLWLYTIKSLARRGAAHTRPYGKIYDAMGSVSCARTKCIGFHQNYFVVSLEASSSLTSVNISPSKFLPAEKSMHNHTIGYVSIIIHTHLSNAVCVVLSSSLQTVLCPRQCPWEQPLLEWFLWS